MKITKRQLRRIIKEEKQKLLQENYDQGYDDFRNDVPDPAMPDDDEYMEGWEDAELDSRVKDMDVRDYE